MEITLFLGEFLLITRWNQVMLYDRHTETYDRHTETYDRHTKTHTWMTTNKKDNHKQLFLKQEIA